MEFTQLDFCGNYFEFSRDIVISKVLIIVPVRCLHGFLRHWVRFGGQRISEGGCKRDCWGSLQEGWHRAYWGVDTRKEKSCSEYVSSLLLIFHIFSTVSHIIFVFWCGFDDEFVVFGPVHCSFCLFVYGTITMQNVKWTIWVE